MVSSSNGFHGAALQALNKLGVPWEQGDSTQAYNRGSPPKSRLILPSRSGNVSAAGYPTAVRSFALSDKPDLQTLLEVQDYFALPSTALVEKDWFVVRALAAIHDVEVDGLTLAFGGGTALGRAYRLLERMSEDIDLRIVGKMQVSAGPSSV